MLSCTALEALRVVHRTRPSEQTETRLVLDAEMLDRRRVGEFFSTLRQGALLTFDDRWPYFAPGFTPIAHRGGSLRFPENTLLAFRGAMQLGFRWIETDVHCTSDGHLVVFHDAELGRTTNGRGRVGDHSLAELKTLDAAYRFSPGGGGYPYRGQGVTIPTLEEAFDLSSELRFNVEMKGDDLRLPARVDEFARAHGVQDRILAAAANDDLTAAFRRLNAQVPTSPGVKGILRFWLGVRTRVHTSYPFQVLQVPPEQYGLRVLDKRFVDDAHARGIRVHAWTIDDPQQMRRLHSLGVDAIMTDRPEVLMHTLCSGD